MASTQATRSLPIRKPCGGGESAIYSWDPLTATWSPLRTLGDLKSDSVRFATPLPDLGPSLSGEIWAIVRLPSLHFARLARWIRCPISSVKARPHPVPRTDKYMGRSHNLLARALGIQLSVPFRSTALPDAAKRRMPRSSLSRLWRLTAKMMRETTAAAIQDVGLRRHAVRRPALRNEEIALLRHSAVAMLLGAVPERV